MKYMGSDQPYGVTEQVGNLLRDWRREENGLKGAKDEKRETSFFRKLFRGSSNTRNECFWCLEDKWKKAKREERNLLLDGSRIHAHKNRRLKVLFNHIIN